jgi:hypothetical protein
MKNYPNFIYQYLLLAFLDILAHGAELCTNSTAFLEI